MQLGYFTSLPNDIKRMMYDKTSDFAILLNILLDSIAEFTKTIHQLNTEDAQISGNQNV